MSYYLHWDYRTVIGLEHPERERWCREVGEINKKLNGDEGRKDFFEV